MASFCELNLNITNLSEKAIDELVEHAIRLGYDNLGLAVDYEFPPVPAKRNKNEPNAQQDTEQKGKANARAPILIPRPIEYKISPKLHARLQSTCRKIKIFSRINIVIKPEDINVYLHHLKSKSVQNFDLIGLEPSDNQVLMYLCTNNFNADIITINSGIECGLTDKHLIRPIRNAITSLSLCFELNYSTALSSSTERRDLIMAGRCLAFNTKLNGLILSSRASQKLCLRGPYDLLNLVKLFDVTEQDTHKIVRHCPHNVLMNSFCRKHTSIGMVYFNDLNDLKKLEHHLVSYKKKMELDNESNNNTNIKASSEKNETDKMDIDQINKK